jgi:hypothetical protein
MTEIHSAHGRRPSATAVGSPVDGASPACQKWGNVHVKEGAPAKKKGGREAPLPCCSIGRAECYFSMTILRLAVKLGAWMR